MSEINARDITFLDRLGMIDFGILIENLLQMLSCICESWTFTHITHWLIIIVIILLLSSLNNVLVLKSLHEGIL